MRVFKLLSIIEILIITLIFATAQVNAEGDVSKVKIFYGKSEIYSFEDMNSAVKIIKETFRKWDGCELHSIRYTDDDYSNSPENIKWMNELAKSRGYKPNFTQCITFFSSFHSPTDPKDNKTSFNTNEEYSNWSWYLARTEGGDWKLITFGY